MCSSDLIDCCVGMVGFIADGPDEVRRAARENIRRDVDQIKIMASGGAMSPSDELDTTQFTVAEMRAAVEEARAVGKYVLSHAYSDTAVRNAIEAGVRSVGQGHPIREAAARAPGDWEPQLGLGRLALAARDLDKAAAALEVAAQKGPQQAEVQVGLGDLDLARKAGDAAVARYRQALVLDPGSARARYGLARGALARGDEKAALGELAQALALDPRLGPAARAPGVGRATGRERG